MKTLRFAFYQTVPVLLGYSVLGIAFGVVLQRAVMAILVVYCLKNVNIFAGNHSLPELIAVCITAVLHLWRKNTLLSILGGTAAYMLLLRLVF